jgi:hypothetical protein
VIATVFLEIAFTNKDMMILFPPHCQGLGVDILLSHQHPDKGLYNFIILPLVSQAE